MFTCVYVLFMCRRTYPKFILDWTFILIDDTIGKQSRAGAPVSNTSQAVESIFTHAILNAVFNDSSNVILPFAIGITQEQAQAMANLPRHEYNAEIMMDIIGASPYIQTWTLFPQNQMQVSSNNKFVIFV